MAPGFVVEDSGDGFFLIIEGRGHDTTISLDDELALSIASYITRRRATRGPGAERRN